MKFYSAQCIARTNSLSSINQTPSFLSRILICRSDRTPKKYSRQSRSGAKRKNNNRHSSLENINEKRDYHSTTKSSASCGRRQTSADTTRLRQNHGGGGRGA